MAAWLHALIPPGQVSGVAGYGVSHERTIKTEPWPHESAYRCTPMATSGLTRHTAFDAQPALRIRVRQRLIMRGSILCRLLGNVLARVTYLST